MIAPLLLACTAALQEGRAELPLRLAGARDATGEGFAFVEAVASTDAPFVGEPVRVAVRFGIEAEFLATKAVQPFGRPLDVPVQVLAPWIAPAPERVVEGPSLALEDSVAAGRRIEDRVVDGRPFVVHEIDARVVPEKPGELALEAPRLALAYATRYEESLVRGRAPLDRVDVFVDGKPVVLVARPWPVEGRPEEFTGAVGDLSVRAEVEDREVAMGESLKLALIVEGDGNLELFDAPRFDRLGAFRVLGTVDERSPTLRRIVYDLAPESDQAWQVPPIPFAYLHPGPPAEYRVARTETVDVVVRRDRNETEAGTTAPSPPAEPAESGDERSVSWLAWAAGAVILALVGWIAARRRLV